MEERKNRLAYALNLRGLKQVDVCEKCNIAKTTVNGWIKQKCQPKQNALYKMAKLLDVSELWLAGYDVPMERPLEQKQYERHLAYIEAMRNNYKYDKVMDYIVQLDDNSLLIVETMLKGLVEGK